MLNIRSSTPTLFPAFPKGFLSFKETQSTWVAPVIFLLTVAPHLTLALTVGDLVRTIPATVTFYNSCFAQIGSGHSPLTPIQRYVPPKPSSIILNLRTLRIRFNDSKFYSLFNIQSRIFLYFECFNNWGGGDGIRRFRPRGGHQNNLFRG